MLHSRCVRASSTIIKWDTLPNTNSYQETDRTPRDVLPRWSYDRLSHRKLAFPLPTPIALIGSSSILNEYSVFFKLNGKDFVRKAAPQHCRNFRLLAQRLLRFSIGLRNQPPTNFLAGHVWIFISLTQELANNKKERKKTS
jgi:hypothetical protein